LNDFEKSQCAKLLAENGQLKAQNAAMREALEEAISSITAGRLCSIGSINNTYAAQISAASVERWIKVLSTAPATYHNPADVEALAKAREVLNALDIRGGLGFEKHEWIRQAIEQIDKAGGGDT
jgi:Holliday junction resolvasome RuvABC DNA-binding subunit